MKTPLEYAIDGLRDIAKDADIPTIIKQSRFIARAAGGGYWIEMAYQYGDKVQWRHLDWVSNKQDAILRMKKLDRNSKHQRRFRVVSENEVIEQTER